MIKFEDVQHQTTEDYFNGNEFSIDIFKKKYALNENETYVQAVKRVTDFAASVEETDELKKYWSERWFDEIYNDWWHPGGSIMQGAASGKNLSLANCTTINAGKLELNKDWDTLESLYRNIRYSVAKVAAYRQGLGVDLSRIRPNKSRIMNAANKSDGVIHWMKSIDNVGYEVGQCLYPDTKILTKDGYKTIKRIVEEKYNGHILTPNGSSEIINWFKNPKKEMFLIKTEYGDEIIASKDHKILIANKNGEPIEIPIKDLKPGDFICCSVLDFNKLNGNINNVKFSPFTYELNEYNNSNRLSVPPKTPKELNESLGYILGVIYGDGCSYDEKIEIAFSDEWVDILNKFDNELYKCFGVHIGEYGVHKKNGDGKCKKITLGKYYYKFFEHIGALKGKSNNLMFPDILKNAPESVLISFFGGLFDADGHVSKTKTNLQFSIIDKEFINTLKLELHKFGYIVKIREKIRKTRYKNSSKQHVPTYNLSLVGKDSLTKIQGANCSIKLNKIRIGRYDKLKTPYNAKYLKINYNKYLEINGGDYLSFEKYSKYTNKISPTYIQKIESISSFGESETYDITVLDTSHIFAAPIIFVSNSGRIPAMLLSLNIDHPDVIDFIKIKSDRSIIQNANISVQITDDFYKCVEDDGVWTMRFEVPEVKKGQKIYVHANSVTDDYFEDDNGRYHLANLDRQKEVVEETIGARDLLRLLAKNMYDNAEPGVQNMDIARRYSNSDALYPNKFGYDSRVISSNACSEQMLDGNGTCNLAAANAEKFSSDFEQCKKELEIVTESSNRFLDNIIQCEINHHTYPLEGQRISNEMLRRNGIGSTNLGGYLFKLNMEYGSEEGNKVLIEFQKYFTYYLYKSSVKLGKEKGNFKLFDPERIKDSLFIQNLLNEFPDLELTHLRNVCLSTIAPSGTITMLFRDTAMSYGVEPSFDLCYWKRTRMGGKYEYYFTVPHAVREFFKEKGYTIPMKSDTVKDTWDGKTGKPIMEFINQHKNELEIHFKSSLEVSAFDKLKLMEGLIKWVDSSISVTYMIPEDYSVDKVYDIILDAQKKNLKSITVYRDKRMYGIVSFIPFKDLAFKLKAEGVQMHSQNFSDKELSELSMTNTAPRRYGDAPKRKKILEADVYSVIVSGEKFVVAVGIQDGYPYEMFCGKMNGLNFAFKERKGKIEKMARGIYKLDLGDIAVDDFSEHFKPAEQALFRMVSLNLRTGTPIKYIHEQLLKSEDSMITLTAAAARVLKKYIIDGEKATGQTCPVCGNTELTYSDGCVSCNNCEWSKC